MAVVATGRCEQDHIFGELRKISIKFIDEHLDDPNTARTGKICARTFEHGQNFASTLKIPGIICYSFPRNYCVSKFK